MTRDQILDHVGIVAALAAFFAIAGGVMYGGFHQFNAGDAYPRNYADAADILKTCPQLAPDVAVALKDGKLTQGEATDLEAKAIWIQKQQDDWYANKRDKERALTEFNHAPAQRQPFYGCMATQNFGRWSTRTLFE